MWPGVRITFCAPEVTTESRALGSVWLRMLPSKSPRALARRIALELHVDVADHVGPVGEPLLARRRHRCSAAGSCESSRRRAARNAGTRTPRDRHDASAANYAQASRTCHALAEPRACAHSFTHSGDPPCPARPIPLRVAAVQAAPVFLDLDGTIDKTIELISQAAGQGVQADRLSRNLGAGLPVVDLARFAGLGHAVRAALPRQLAGRRLAGVRPHRARPRASTSIWVVDGLQREGRRQPLHRRRR